VRSRCEALQKMIQFLISTYPDVLSLPITKTFLQAPTSLLVMMTSPYFAFFLFSMLGFLEKGVLLRWCQGETPDILTISLIVNFHFRTIDLETRRGCEEATILSYNVG
jgi:hypothetical protein